MLSVGILGLGTEWETKYRPALQQLRGRICPRGIYDPVLNRAAQAAAELKIAHSGGMLELIGRSDIHAILMLQDGWYRDAALAFCATHNKPLFFSGATTWRISGQTHRQEARESTAAMIMPALRLRYTPATSRLRELMATRLGHPVEIRLALEPPDSDQRGPSDFPAQPMLVAELFDWCRYVVGARAKFVDSTNRESSDPATASVRLHFRQDPGSLPGAIATLDLGTLTAGEAVVAGARFTAHVTCEHGNAIISSDQQITWEHGGATTTENLEGEREPAVVMLDLFCRRVVGGLVPVPTDDDLETAQRTMMAANESRVSGRPVRL